MMIYKNKMMIVLSIICTIISCNNISRDEYLRIKSPDSIVDAVIIEVNAGATTAYVYEVYIVPTGGQPQKGDDIFRADKINGLEIKWDQPKKLEIKYKDGQIFHFSNFWSSQDIDNFRYEVDIDLLHK